MVSGLSLGFRGLGSETLSFEGLDPTVQGSQPTILQGLGQQVDSVL